MCGGSELWKKSGLDLGIDKRQNDERQRKEAKQEIKTDKLTCSLSGGGDATFNGKASNFEVNINGGGDVNAGGLSTDITAFHVSGGSDIHVNVSKELKGNISGGGDIYYAGSPAIVTVDARGGSEVHKE